MSFPRFIGLRSLLLLCLGWGLPTAQTASWSEGTHFRFTPVTPALHQGVGFALVPPQASGVFFTNVMPAEISLTNQIYLNGSGVAAGDYDGDGRCDLYFGAVLGHGRLYRNLGDWCFEDVTAKAGLSGVTGPMAGVVMADVNGDGAPDLLLNTVGGGVKLHLNDQKGHFTNATATSGLVQRGGGSSLALADVDGNGTLDLYVVNYRTTTLRDEPNTQFRVQPKGGRTEIISVNGVPATHPDLAGRFEISAQGAVIENGEADQLYLNDGSGRFTPVPWNSGRFRDEAGNALAGPPYDWGLSAMFYDVNGDGAPDLYVCNDFDSEDRFWLNDGKGNFRLAPVRTFRKTSLFSMGLDWADVNRDGLPDLFVADMLSRSHRRRQVQLGMVRSAKDPGLGEGFRGQEMHNVLQLNRGDSTFAEIGFYAGVEATEWTWSCAFLDVDLDGFEDLLLTTGHERDAQDIDVINQLQQRKTQGRLSPREAVELRRLFPRLATAKMALRNTGQLQFEDKSAAWGFNLPAVSHGMAMADLDNDGDLDLAINNFNGVAELHRNVGSAPRVAVRLKGAGANRAGIGAKITLTGGPMPQTQEMISGGRYLSGDQPMRVFAAGSASRLALEVRWRSGKRSTLTNLQPNMIYEVAETGAQEAPGSSSSSTAARPQSAAWFNDVSSLLGHRHQEDPFDDYGRQPLLHYQPSAMGPGLGWVDLDGDEREELVVAGGRGGALAIYHNGNGKSFSPLPAPPGPLTSSQSAVVAWRGADGRGELLVGSGNDETGSTNEGAVLVLKPGLGGQFAQAAMLPGALASTGPLALGPLEKNGALELFVGGRVVPGQYPQGAPSRLFRQRAGQWELDEENTRVIERARLVSGALWSDLDNDGWPELVLACEWGPVRVFHNNRGTLREETAALGLQQYSGWWTGLTAADVNGDGKMDLVVGNWGANTPYQQHRQKPIRLYYGSLQGLESPDLVLATFDPEQNKYVPWRTFNRMANAMPQLRERFVSFAAYAQAGLEEIAGAQFQSLQWLEANTLESMVFINGGGTFQATPLPREAQWSPVFGVSAADADGDGVEDLFVSQNLTHVDADSARGDSGRGVWFKGDGGGGFKALSGQESGVVIEGEGRGSALCDYDGDGRVDLAVAQHGGATRLFRNVIAQPGLRITLVGTVENPQAIGAQLWLEHQGRRGPTREIHAGSGYWSQDSLVQVLAATGRGPAQLHIRWPGGKKTVTPVSAGLLAITVKADGTVAASR